jgi:predicted peroxiredoxin
MPEESRELVVVISHGTDHELSSVGFTIANGGLTAGLKVAIFLTSAGVDLVRRKAADTTQVKPLDPLLDMMSDFVARGGTLYACTPCVKARGYEQTDLIDGVTIAGSSVIHERFKRGAAGLSF